MNKSLRRKLIMSAVAVGAAAVGTTASTYAWFVTNSNVSSTVTGSVEKAGANIYISNDGQNYGTKSVSPLENFDNLKMAPLQMKKADHLLYDLNDTAKTKNVDYMEFTLYFSVQNLDVANNNYGIMLTTTAKDLDVERAKTHEAQTTVTGDGTYKTITQGKSLWDNVLKALNVEIAQEYSSSNEFADNSTSKYYALNKSEAIYDGLKYYNDISGNDKEETGTESVEEGALTATPLETSENVETIESITATGESQIVTDIPNNGYYKLVFKVWLDGWDKACFDAIASHQFDLGLKFELTTSAKAA